MHEGNGLVKTIEIKDSHGRVIETKEGHNSEGLRTMNQNHQLMLAVSVCKVHWGIVRNFFLIQVEDFPFEMAKAYGTEYFDGVVQHMWRRSSPI